jgi:hypothetical protein
VTITTAFQGEGGGNGTIHLTNDVNHTYNSAYPLIFNCSGTGGIKIDGTLKNSGTGTISLNSDLITVTGQLEGRELNAHGVLICSGNLLGHTLHFQSGKGANISGHVVADGGPLTWIGGETLRIKGGEIGNAGNESLTLQGFENILLEKRSRIHTFHSNLNITDLSGTLSIEDSAIRGSGPLSISGNQGSLHLNHGTLESANQLNINIGRFLHSHDSVILSHQPLSISVGHDIILTGDTLVTSTSGISMSNKGNLFLADKSTIRGQGLCLFVGESTYLYTDSQIDGQKGSLTLTTGDSLSIEGKGGQVSSGQVAIHAGQKISLENQGSIFSTQGAVSVSAGTGLHLFEQGKISASGGNLDLHVLGGNLTLTGNSALHSKTDGANLFIGKSLLMEHFSRIESIGEKGTVIVVDQMHQGGGFVTDVNASILTGSSPLQIFTAAPRYNSIQGTLNGHRYTLDMPLYLTTSQDRWGTTYPDLFFEGPFAVFHKEDGLIQTHIGPINQKTYIRYVVDFIGPFTAELFRRLHPYNEYTRELIDFTDNEEPYFIMRRTKK